MKSPSHLSLRYLVVQLLFEVPGLLLESVSQLCRLLLPLSGLSLKSLSEVVIVTQKQEQNLLQIK